MKIHYYFTIILSLSIFLLTGCGGGSDDSIIVNNLPKNSKSIVGTWYINFENDNPVYSNKSGMVGHLIIKADGTYTNNEYGHEYYEKPEPHYITSDYEVDTWPGIWYEQDGVYYFKDGNAVDSCIYNKDEDTLVYSLTSQQYDKSSPLWVTTYKRTHNGKYSAQ